MDLKVIRGDTQLYKFRRVDMNDNTMTDHVDQIYFTVKDKTLPRNFIFQKTLDDMTVDEDGYYHFRIDPKDTASMRFGDYMYDIEIIRGDITKTVAIGKFIVLQEVTFVSNER